MGQDKTNGLKSRRWFLSLFKLADDKSTTPGKVKMLTADGKLVEIDQSVLDKASNKQKATNQDIFNWMDNPSKENK